ncbi:MAG TPA: four helix bundle protein [Candidatus Saccharimonadales bacterium]|nr:four helix bundle protein [Candidatus Saccharimonadales bacterium]
MATATSFRDLRIFQLATQLASDVYHLTGNLPATDHSDLAAHLQRIAVDIPTLIAIGHKSGKRSLFRTSCIQALARLDELEVLLVVGGELHPSVPSNDIVDQLDEVRQALKTVVKKLAAPKRPAKTV